jgi:hypothetical protein
MVPLVCTDDALPPGTLTRKLSFGKLGRRIFPAYAQITGYGKSGSNTLGACDLYRSKQTVHDCGLSCVYVHGILSW